MLVPKSIALCSKLLMKSLSINMFYCSLFKFQGPASRVPASGFLAFELVWEPHATENHSDIMSAHQFIAVDLDHNSLCNLHLSLIFIYLKKIVNQKLKKRIMFIHKTAMDFNNNCCCNICPYNEKCISNFIRSKIRIFNEIPSDYYFFPKHV